ncbi:MAG: hypothetical protein RQ752_01400 [Thermohalobaculum sp.]|nr:hypothetical protein [Thermohalobaculum sp.]
MRLSRFLVAGLGLALAAGLSGCSLFGGEEEASTGLLFDKPEAAALRPPAPVQALRNIEIGRTRDGYAIVAYGTAPTTGFGAASLAPRRDGQPGTDGYLDFDFVAVPPDPALNMPQGSIASRAIRADTFLTIKQVGTVRGLRVHSATNSGQVDF